MILFSYTYSNPLKLFDLLGLCSEITSILRIPGSATYEAPSIDDKGNIRTIILVTQQEHTVGIPAKSILKGLLPDRVASALSEAADLSFGYRVHAEYEIWKEMEYVEGVIYDSRTPGQIDDVVSGPFPVNPGVRPTGVYSHRPAGETFKESIWKVCTFGVCETFGAWD